MLSLVVAGGRRMLEPSAAADQAAGQIVGHVGLQNDWADQFSNMRLGSQPGGWAEEFAQVRAQPYSLCEFLTQASEQCNKLCASMGRSKA